MAQQKPCTIELDCPPGTPRPDDLLPAVLEGTGLPVREPISKFFGNFTWDYEDMREVFIKAKPTLQERIEKLYYEGVIRYGSW